MPLWLRLLLCVLRAVEDLPLPAVGRGQAGAAGSATGGRTGAIIYIAFFEARRLQ
jgi:hypothetical protein